MNKLCGGIRTILALAGLLTIAAWSVPAGAAGELATGDSETSASTQFLQKAMQGSMAEIELGELAQRNAGTSGINALGSRLARDHRRIGKILELISRERGVVAPVAIDSDQRLIVSSLGSMTGAEFDTAYAARMVISHQNLIDLFDEAAAGSDPDVAAFAKQALPMLREGKRLAEVYREVTSRHREQAPPQSQTVAQTG